MICPHCGGPAERNGNCASLNRANRKAEQEALKEKPLKTAIQPRSDKRAKQESEYSRKVKKWKVGKVCALQGKHITPCYGTLTNHHQKGKIGDLLNDERYWLPVCLGHHRYIEEHPTEAYQEGWSLLRTQTEPHTI